MRFATLTPNYRETNAPVLVTVAPAGTAMTFVTPGRSCVIDDVPANVAVVINYLELENELEMFSQRQIVNFVLAFLGTVVALIVGVTLFMLFWPA
jgi:hypothetical protein